MVAVRSDQTSAGSFVSMRRTAVSRSEEHTSELQSPCNLVCRLLLPRVPLPLLPTRRSSDLVGDELVEMSAEDRVHLDGDTVDLITEICENAIGCGVDLVVDGRSQIRPDFGRVVRVDEANGGLEIGRAHV